MNNSPDKPDTEQDPKQKEIPTRRKELITGAKNEMDRRAAESTSTVDTPGADPIKTTQKETGERAKDTSETDADLTEDQKLKRITDFLNEVEVKKRELSLLDYRVKLKRESVADISNRILNLHPHGAEWAQKLANELLELQNERYLIVNLIKSKGHKLLSVLTQEDSSEDVRASVELLEGIKSRYLEEDTLIEQSFQSINAKLGNLVSSRRNYEPTYGRGVVTDPPVEGDQAAYRQDRWG